MSLAITLLVIGIILVVLEVFLPSGGIISVLAAAAFIASIVYAFKVSSEMGMLVIAMLVVLLPTAIVLGLKLFPKTALGKKFILAQPNQNPNVPIDPRISETNFDSLTGKTGIAVTPLRPSGIAEIEGQRYSVVSEGEMIDNNTPIMVTAVEGNRVIVNINNQTNS